MISMKLNMKLQRLKLIIFCSNDNPGLIVTYFIAFCNLGFYMGKCDNNGFFRKINASCVLEFGL